MKTKTLIAVATAMIACASRAMIEDRGDEDSPKGDARVRKTLNSTDLSYSVDKDGDFRLSFSLKDDRSQLVFVNSHTTEFRNLELREVWTFAAEREEGFTKEELERLLKYNAAIKFGAWQISGKRAIFSCRVAATLGAKSLESVIRLVAEAGDELERELTNGKDKF